MMSGGRKTNRAREIERCNLFLRKGRRRCAVALAAVVEVAVTEEEEEGGGEEEEEEEEQAKVVVAVHLLGPSAGARDEEDRERGCVIVN